MHPAMNSGNNIGGAVAKPETLSVVQEQTLKQLDELEIVLEQINTALTGPRPAGENGAMVRQGGTYYSAMEIRTRVLWFVRFASEIRDGL